MTDVPSDDREPRPSEQSYDEDGIDRSVIRWMLTLTADERLAVLEEMLETVASARRVRNGPP